MTVRIGFALGNDGGQPKTGLGRSLAFFRAYGVHDDRYRAVTIGYQRYRASDLAAVRRAGGHLRATVVGWLRLDDDISTEVAEEVFERLRVIGWRSGPPVPA